MAKKSVEKEKKVKTAQIKTDAEFEKRKRDELIKIIRPEIALQKKIVSFEQEQHRVGIEQIRADIEERRVDIEKRKQEKSAEKTKKFGQEQDTRPEKYHTANVDNFFDVPIQETVKNIDSFFVDVMANKEEEKTIIKESFNRISAVSCKNKTIKKNKMRKIVQLLDYFALSKEERNEIILTIKRNLLKYISNSVYQNSRFSDVEMYNDFVNYFCVIREDMPEAIQNRLNKGFFIQELKMGLVLKLFSKYTGSFNFSNSELFLYSEREVTVKEIVTIKEKVKSGGSEYTERREYNELGVCTIAVTNKNFYYEDKGVIKKLPHDKIVSIKYDDTAVQLSTGGAKSNSLSLKVNDTFFFHNVLIYAKNVKTIFFYPDFETYE